MSLSSTKKCASKSSKRPIPDSDNRARGCVPIGLVGDPRDLPQACSADILLDDSRATTCARRGGGGEVYNNI